MSDEAEGEEEDLDRDEAQDPYIKEIIARMDESKRFESDF